MKSIALFVLLFFCVSMTGIQVFAEEDYMTESGEVRQVTDGEIMTDSGEMEDVGPGGEYMMEDGEIGQVSEGQDDDLSYDPMDGPQKFDDD